MIAAESIDYAEYTRAAQNFRSECPERAWGLTFPLNGMSHYYKVPEYDGYFCFRTVASGVAELCGVFSRHKSGGELIRIALDTLRQHGYKQVRLDCFQRVVGVWVDAGLRATSSRKWEYAYKPTLWRPEYGRQDVFYMERDL